MSTSPTPSSTASSSGPRAAHLSTWWPAPARLTTPLLASACWRWRVVAAFVGPYPISLADALRAVLNRLSGEIPPAGSTLDTVLFFVRLPRIAAAMLVGAALAAAGAAYQGLFRNPLVSPDILGVSAGAGLGAVLGIFLSLPVLGIQLLAFVVGLGTVGLVLLVAASVRGREPVLVLVLAGVVVGALAGSAISLLKVLADPYDQLPAITFWLLGSLAAIKLEDLATTVPVARSASCRWRCCAGGSTCSRSATRRRARSASTRARLRIVVIAAATLMTASVVAIAGMIGWVGLIMPHMARMLVGPNFDRLLPAAMLLGAGYLLLVDTLARTIAAVEMPLGILTAFVGAPFFLWLLARGRHGWA